ncbi:zinc-binding dehydrogenase [Rhodococcus oxybenzonivorans]|uniref:alcohol dehydrogenase catalytic domain-containing protein n=1 Tax=Rhodococcus oxybenzonivorans TaxID=1990687 RepID=UPI002954E33C|nr:zinc-binding dehydrogenase [Rhodococcus oxybenzonivorans]MDV7353672.1 zinc-binding dehydrogenase [Rhodococcus oxybenzonivorans]
MRAWVYHGNNDIRREELPEPAPGPGQVAVKIAFNGICGTDLHEIFHGPMFIPVSDPDPRTGHVGPVTLGHEASGTVKALGDGVSDLRIGQRVAIEPIVRGSASSVGAYNLDAAFYGLMAPGFLADTAVVNRASVHPVPDSVSLADAALTEPLATCWHAVTKTNLTEGDSSVVFGAGPIGIGTALSLRARGVERVAVVEPSDNRRKILDELGFTTIDPRSHDYHEELDEFAGPGVKATFDAAGVASVVSDGITTLAPLGQLVIVATHVAPVPIDLNSLLIAEKSIVSSVAYLDDFGQVIDLLAKGAFPSSSWVETVPFDRFLDQGVESVRAGSAVKVLIEVSGE